MDVDRMLELLAAGGQRVEEELRVELIGLATSIKEAVQELNERVMAVGSYDLGPTAIEGTD